VSCQAAYQHVSHPAAENNNFLSAESMEMYVALASYTFVQNR